MDKDKIIKIHKNSRQGIVMMALPRELTGKELSDYFASTELRDIIIENEILRYTTVQGGEFVEEDFGTNIWIEGSQKFSFLEKLLYCCPPRIYSPVDFPKKYNFIQFDNYGSQRNFDQFLDSVSHYLYEVYQRMARIDS
ncbi:MAG: hypothetical protein Q8N88_05430 [Nanoarchaeota archaeon]|nr:hypothetical protein [Nanoarchaeota archaeon]